MLNKTEKGRAELQPGKRLLDQRHRAVLLMADGRTDTASLNALFGGLGSEIVRNLLAQGYIAEEAPAIEKSVPILILPEPVLPSAAPKMHQGAADAFTGPRSLASARMFLFDISERMFAPREKAVAQQFRDALREARDAKAMLDVSREMLLLIEAKAGAARADAISERLAKLLPESTMENT